MIRRRIDGWIAAVLATLLAGAAVAVAVAMFSPSDREAVEMALAEKAGEILSAARSYPVQFPAELRIADSDTISSREAVDPAPFNGLSFDRIGYFDNLSVDGRTLSTPIGRFTLLTAPDGGSFSLTATGADGISLAWSEVTAENVPDPERIR